jgi:hypothetical protein
MTNDGYVPLSLIASFNLVRSLCDDIYLIADVRLKNRFLFCSEKGILVYIGSTR